MSIILNALRKSDQERQTRQPETLENKILEKLDTVQKNNPVWLIALVTINAFFLLIFFWSFTKENMNKDVDKKTIIVEKVEIKDKEKVNTSLAHILEPTAKIQISIAEQLKDSLPGNVKKDKEKREPEQLNENLISNDIKDEEKRELKSEQKKTHRVKRKKKPVTTTVLVEEPALEMVTKNTNKEDQQKNVPPFLSELDYDFRRRVPDININVFVYSEIKADRFIMIDMKKYLPGQQLDSGMKLKEIRLNSIVVEYKNRVFQVQRY